MPPQQSPTEETLRSLQDLVRRPASAEDSALTFRLPVDFVTAEGQTLSVDAKTVDAMALVVQALEDDWEFEHLDKPTDLVRLFAARAWARPHNDCVDEFLAEHRRAVRDAVCYLPVEYLVVDTVESLLGISLLPLGDPSIPEPVGPPLPLDGPVGCVAAVSVRGTDHARMLTRARAQAEHALRVMRVGLREHNGVHNRQLRFRLGIGFVFDDHAGGWTSRSDIAYETNFGPRFAEMVGSTPVWGMTANPTTDVDRKADVALRWMERSRFSGEPLVALLYLFFALEALLGDKSERMKADGLAFRQMLLSHLVTGAFRHPDTTWFMYDQIRSAAVHGEDVSDVDEATVQSFEWSVRDTLNDYLRFTGDNQLVRRGKLIRQLREHPDVPKIIEWLRNNGGPFWTNYLTELQHTTKAVAGPGEG